MSSFLDYAFDEDLSFTDEQNASTEKVHLVGVHFINTILSCTPVSREQSLAMTNLEQAVFWAKSAIAHHAASPASDAGA